MRLLILTTGNEFTPSMLYKENYIIKAAKLRGDEVFVYANQFTYVSGKSVVASNVEVTDGYTLKRFKYRSYGLNIITNKIRRIDSLEREIIEIKPDLIFINCPQVYNVKNICFIKRHLPNVKVVLDFSTKYLNSARNWISRTILHRHIYRHWIKKALPYVDKVFYISQESREFAQEMYDLPDSILEHNNLPGEMIPKEEKFEYKRKIFKRLGFSRNNFLFLYSGKIYPDKNVDQLIRAFIRSINAEFRLVIIGAFLDDTYKSLIESLIQSDERIIFMNFVSGDELTQFICAADLYIQPGSISQTCQTAVCCGTPLCFNDIPTHREIYNGNGFFSNSEEELVEVFAEVGKNPDVLCDMIDYSYKLAKEELDYNVIYKKILNAVKISD